MSADKIERLKAHNARGWGRNEAGSPDVLDYNAPAFTIHTICDDMENCFLEYPSFFKNNLPGDSWHRALVERVFLSITGAVNIVKNFSFSVSFTERAPHRN